jgi:hypothetical protein
LYKCDESKAYQIVLSGDTLEFIPLGCDIGLTPVVSKVSRHDYAALLKGEGAENSELFFTNGASRGIQAFLALKSSLY